MNADGRLEVFIVGGTTLYHIWQVSPGNWGQQQWQLLGTGQLASAPAVAMNADGRLELFAQFTGDFVQHAKQGIAGDPTSWGTWTSLDGGGASYAPTVIRNANGRLEVFVVGGTTLFTIINKLQEAAGRDGPPWVDR